MTYPHCDARILHKPGVCDVCDEYAPDLQEKRVRLGINFTGEHLSDLAPCPADVARGPDSYNQWGGNTPKKGPVLGYDWAGYPVTDADPRLRVPDGGPRPIPGMPFFLTPRASAFVHRFRIVYRKLFG